jgi:hypothetical protein
MIDPSEGYTIMKLNKRYYPMTVSFDEKGFPTISAMKDPYTGEVICYVKRATAVSYTYIHASEEAVQKRQYIDQSQKV